jgi:hypothetical protein
MAAPEIQFTTSLIPEAGERVPARREISQHLYVILVLCAAGLGLALRLRAAAGDLWLDEIWSLNLVKRARTIGDVFIHIPYDNNHFLNSAWLWTVGPNASVVVMRLAAVAFGTLSIPVAAAIGRRFCNLSGAIAAFLIAAGYFFVHYGSEARGYSGMILAILLEYFAIEQICDDEDRRDAFVLFAAAICFGTFSHLTMVEATAVLCVTGAARVMTKTKPLAARLRTVATIFVIAALATLPALACFAVGTLSPEFRVGVMEPFSFSALAQGLAEMARATLGFPQSIGDVAVVTAAAVVAFAFLALITAPRRWFPAFAIFGLPAVHAALHLPSQFYARFHLTAAVALILLASDALAALWRREGSWRAVAVAGLFLIAAGQGVELRNFFEAGRGAYADAVKTMSVQGGVAYSADNLENETKSVVAYEAARLGVTAAAVGDADWCAAPPGWLIVANTPRSQTAPSERRLAGPAACRTSYRRDRVFPAWGLSGFAWTLFRRSE